MTVLGAVLPATEGAERLCTAVRGERADNDTASTLHVKVLRAVPEFAEHSVCPIIKGIRAAGCLPAHADEGADGVAGFAAQGAAWRTGSPEPEVQAVTPAKLG